MSVTASRVRIPCPPLNPSTNSLHPNGNPGVQAVFLRLAATPNYPAVGGNNRGSTGSCGEYAGKLLSAESIFAMAAGHTWATGVAYLESRIDFCDGRGPFVGRPRALVNLRLNPLGGAFGGFRLGVLTFRGNQEIRILGAAQRSRSERTTHQRHRPRLAVTNKADGINIRIRGGS